MYSCRRNPYIYLVTHFPVPRLRKSAVISLKKWTVYRVQVTLIIFCEQYLYIVIYQFLATFWAKTAGKSLRPSITYSVESVWSLWCVSAAVKPAKSQSAKTDCMDQRNLNNPRRLTFEILLSRPDGCRGIKCHFFPLSPGWTRLSLSTHMTSVF